MIRRSIGFVFTAAMVLALVACSEAPQKASMKKSDTEAWQATDSAFVAPGWKEGDRSSWEEQLRNRALGQNDYAKTK
jgi:hypothetical protein